MYYGKPNKSLDDKAIEILKTGVSQICKIKSRIFSVDKEEVTATPIEIEQFTVAQLFEREFHDKITITLNINLEEAMLLLTNYQNLRMTFRIEHVTQHYYQTIESIEQEVREFIAIIHNPTDLLKAIQKVELVASKNPDDQGEFKPDDIRSRRYSLQVELLNEKLMEFRTKPVSNLGSGTDSNAMLVGAALAVGLDSKQIEFAKAPDNKRKMNSIPIPPMQTMSSMFDLMQESYGTYKNGMEYYYTEDKLRIYPGYDTDPQSERILHLYRLPKESYPGDCKYHYQDEEGNLHVLIIDDVDIKNLADASVESSGNYQVARRSDAGLDVDVIQNGKDATIRNNNLITMAAQNENISTSNKTAARYMPTTNNALMMSSDMASTFCKILSTGWRMAWPWLVIPGMKVMYHYEEVSGLKVTTGILSSIECSLAKIDGTVGDHNSYAWGANIIARLSPNEQDEEKLSTDVLSALKKTSSF